MVLDFLYDFFLLYAFVSNTQEWFQQVYWPLDDDWYCGSVVGYNPETERHHVMIILSIYTSLCRLC